ncbi:MAG: CBS domain-containing protein [Burkholderiales bacterium]
MLIRDILQMKGGQIFGIAPDRPLAEAVREMVARDIGSLVVLDGGGMRGMLTFREVLKALDSHGGALGGTLTELRVADVMVRDPVAGQPGDSVEHLRELMTQNHVRYLPVVDGGRLAGVISFHDVAKAVINQAAFENRLLRRYIESTPEAAAPPPV